jgi:hypothetical protein
LLSGWLWKITGSISLWLFGWIACWLACWLPDKLTGLLPGFLVHCDIFAALKSVFLGLLAGWLVWLVPGLAGCFYWLNDWLGLLVHG